MLVTSDLREDRLAKLKDVLVNELSVESAVGLPVPGLQDRVRENPVLDADAVYLVTGALAIPRLGVCLVRFPLFAEARD